MVTDLEENCSVNLPKEVNETYESQIGVLRDIVLMNLKCIKMN